jgi:transposase InsO family protein
MAFPAGDRGSHTVSKSPTVKKVGKDCMITVRCDFHSIQRFDEVFDSSYCISCRICHGSNARCFAMYKRKGRKVNPVNAPLPNGISPGGESVRDTQHHAGKTVPRGSRLTPERLKMIKIGDGKLSEGEKGLFVDSLFEFEGAIAFDDDEMGLLDTRIEPPVKAHVIPHIPWQQSNLRLPKAMQDIATTIVKEKLEKGLFERSFGPYRSRYFLVAKKPDGSWRFINDVQPLNKVTIRDAGMPPAVDDFSEDFAGYPITSSVDFYSSYNEILLDIESRDLTAFLTEIGLIRQTRLPQGWTNSVAVFQRIICKVLEQHIPHHAKPFVDDVGIRGPKSRYNDEEIAPGIRRFVWEHVQIFRGIMRSIWISGMTVSGLKLALGMSRINIVGMVCDEEGRHPDFKKVQKILDWPIPQSTTDVRAFLGTCVFFRIFIDSFSIVAAPLFELLRKSAKYEFQWGARQQNAMDSLKLSLSSPPTLVPLDFSPSASPIVLTTDASTIGWGAILQQAHNDELLHPARYDSGVWNDAEKKYDPVKLECRGLLKALKKFRFWLFGRTFVVETDAQTLVWLLNQPPNDLPNALLTRWLSYIRLFDFNVRHIPGRRNGGADGLSRRGRSPLDPPEVDDVDDYFEAALYAVSVKDSNPLQDVWLDEEKYTDLELILGKYLSSLTRPLGLSDAEFVSLKRKAYGFFVLRGFLYKRGKNGYPPRRVVGLKEERLEVLKGCHEEAGHRGRDGTIDRLKERYYWDGMYIDALRYAESCEECQRRAKIRYEEPLHPTWSVYCFEKVGVDVVHMPNSAGFRYIIFARDDFTGWVEGQPLRKISAEKTARFLHEFVILRHGCPANIVFDNGAENRGEVGTFLAQLGIKKIRISAYHPQSNGLVERGHAPIINALSKYAEGDKGGWYKFLPLVLWADRVSIRRSTGFAPFRLLYGHDCVLPIELSVASWAVVDWNRVKTREELLMARMTQMDRQVLERETATERLRLSRLANKERFDNSKRMRPGKQQLRLRDLVLLYDSSIDKTHDRKMDDVWVGPYRIQSIEPNGSYRLMELDGIERNGTVAGNRLKRFFPRSDFSLQG